MAPKVAQQVVQQVTRLLYNVEIRTLDLESQFIFSPSPPLLKIHTIYSR